MIDRILDALQQSLEPFLAPLWASTTLWRMTTLFLLLALATVITFRSRLIPLLMSDRTKEHDEEVFARSNAKLPEAQFMDFLDDLLGDHKYFDGQSRRLYEFVELFREEGNQYLNSDLRKKSVALRDTLAELQTFIVTHFFLHPPNQELVNSRFCMYPDLNIDRGGDWSEDGARRYGARAKELSEIGDRAERQYREYRKAVKSRLAQ